MDKPEDVSIQEMPEGEGAKPTGDAQAETQMQTQEAVESLGQMPEIRPENWGSLDSTERLGTLQNIEDQMANIQGRPPVPVETQEMPQNMFGGYNPSSERITLNTAHLNGNQLPASEFVDTIVHEGRHAYQDYAIKNPGFLNDQQTVQSWAENMKDYRTLEADGVQEYMNQPIEADAWGYAGEIVSQLYQQGQKE